MPQPSRTDVAAVRALLLEWSASPASLRLALPHG